MPAWLDNRLDAVCFALASVALVALARRLVRSLPPVHRRRRGYLLAQAAIVTAGVLLAELAGRHEATRNHAMVAGMAPTYAAELERLGIAGIDFDTPADDPTYLQLIDAQLRWLRCNRTIADIYTFRQRPDGSIALLVDSETDYDRDGVFRGEREERTAIGEAYDEGDDSLLAAFAGRSTFQTEPTTDRWGTWVSAYEPLHAPDGSQCGVLGVDYPAAAWAETIGQRRASVLAVAFLLVGLLVAGRTAVMLSLARAHADAAATARQRFLAHMSHEIRTPMTAILGHADLLADGDADDGERRRCVDVIQRSGHHLLAILDDILDLAKIEAGNRTAQPRPTDLRAVVADVEALQRQNARHKRLALAVQVDDDVPPLVQTDPRMVRQVLLNLVGNAIKFTATGGITVQVLRPGAGLVLLRVVDTGPGISTADQRRLFQPFEQGDAANSRAHGGTGLGLSISRRLAALLGGTITLETELGAGAAFTLSLPCEVPPAPVAAVPVPTTAADGQGPTTAARVLVVDDGADNRRLLAAILRKGGYDVQTVVDGGACLERVLPPTDAAPPDLVLMDVQMPVLDGHETTRRLRAGGYAGPIVAVTAHAMAEDRALCLDAGCDDYVTKPIDRGLLLSTLQRLLADRQQG